MRCARSWCHIVLLITPKLATSSFALSFPLPHTHTRRVYHFGRVSHPVTMKRNAKAREICTRNLGSDSKAPYVIYAVEGPSRKIPQRAILFCLNPLGVSSNFGTISHPLPEIEVFICKVEQIRKSKNSQEWYWNATIVLCYKMLTTCSVLCTTGNSNSITFVLDAD